MKLVVGLTLKDSVELKCVGSKASQLLLHSSQMQKKKRKTKKRQLLQISVGTFRVELGNAKKITLETDR